MKSDNFQIMSTLQCILTHCNFTCDFTVMAFTFKVRTVCCIVRELSLQVSTLLIYYKYIFNKYINHYIFTINSRCWVCLLWDSLIYKQQILQENNRSVALGQASQRPRLPQIEHGTCWKDEPTCQNQVLMRNEIRPRETR